MPMEEEDDHSTTQQPKNVRFPVGLVEDDSSDSSCMIVLKLPSGQNHVPTSSADTTMSPRESHKQVVYDDASQTSKREERKLDSESYTLAMERAKELRTTLPSEHPSFIKQVQASHVGHRCRMSVPFEFRRSHLPTHNVEIFLEDESGESYKAKYILGKFVGGWRKYSVKHNLIEDKKKRKCEAANRKIPHLDTDQGSLKKCSLLSSNPSLEPGLLDHSSTKKSQSSSDIEACTSSGNDSYFENFKIIVNGEIVDPELPRSIRFKY